MTPDEVLESGEPVKSAQLICPDCPRQALGIGEAAAGIVLLSAGECREHGHAVEVKVPAELRTLRITTGDCRRTITGRW